MVVSITARKAYEKVQTVVTFCVMTFIIFAFTICNLSRFVEHPTIASTVKSLDYFWHFYLLESLIIVAATWVVSGGLFMFFLIAVNDRFATKLFQRFNETSVTRTVFVLVFLLIASQYLFINAVGLRQLRFETERKQICQSGAYDTLVERNRILQQRGYVMLGTWMIDDINGKYKIYPLCIYLINPFGIKNKVEVAKEPQQIPTD